MKSGFVNDNLCLRFLDNSVPICNYVDYKKIFLLIITLLISMVFFYFIINFLLKNEKKS